MKSSDSEMLRRAMSHPWLRTIGSGLVIVGAVWHYGMQNQEIISNEAEDRRDILLLLDWKNKQEEQRLEIETKLASISTELKSNTEMLNRIYEELHSHISVHLGGPK